MTPTIPVGKAHGTGKRFALPIDAFETTAIVAIKGAGKTYTGKKILEGLHGAGEKFVALDPTGVMWGMRLAADGKRQGLDNLIVLGGEHGDLPLDPNTGKLIADVAVDYAESLIIDLSDFNSSESRRFTAAFGTQLYQRKAKDRSPIHVLLDEADEFLPQKPQREQNLVLHAFERLSLRGRSRGIRVLVLTQRPARLNKDILTQCGMLIIMRVIGLQDRKALHDWTGIYGDKATLDELNASIATLKNGEAFFWAPTRGIFQRVQVDRIRTYDSSSTPTGAETRPDITLPPVDVAALQERMAETVEKAKESDPKEWRKRVTARDQRIAELERELAAVKAAQPEPVVETLEVPILTDEDQERLQRVEELLTDVAGDIEPLRATLVTRFATMAGSSAARAAAHRASIQSSPEPYTVDDIRRKEDAPPSNGTTASLPKAERSILTVLALYPDGRMKRQVAIQAGYAHKGGGFNNGLAALRSKGYMTGTGNGPLVATTDGLATLGPVDPLPGGPALREHWQRELPKAERSILGCLAGAGGSLTKDQIAITTDYAVTGGGFNNALSRLRTLGLITREGDAVALSEELL